MKSSLTRLWRGELSLARAFWDFAIFYGSVANLTTTIAAFGALASGLPAPIAVGLFLLPLPYNVAVVVGVWRSAERYEGPAKWAHSARIAVVLWAIVATLL